jgi:hypothetical protein
MIHVAPNKELGRRGGCRITSSERRVGPLSEAARRFLVRCYHETLIDEATLREACSTIGITLDPAAKRP